MLLSGQLGNEDRRVFEEFVLPVCAKIENELKTIPKGLTRDAAIRLYGDLSATPASILNLCQYPKVSSHAVLVLLRSLLEGCISTLAFCKDPVNRAPLYANFPAVLDWLFVCWDEKHVGCLHVPDTPDKRRKLRERKGLAEAQILRLGLPYLSTKKGQDPKTALQQVVLPGNEGKKFFRDKWYPEERQEILASERMGWLYDVVYRRLCSPVHSDPAAGKLFAGLHRGHAFTFALNLWGAAIYRLVETLRLRLPAPEKGLLRQYYTMLQE